MLEWVSVLSERSRKTFWDEMIPKIVNLINVFHQGVPLFSSMYNWSVDTTCACLFSCTQVALFSSLVSQPFSSISSSTAPFLSDVCTNLHSRTPRVRERPHSATQTHASNTASEIRSVWCCINYPRWGTRPHVCASKLPFCVLPKNCCKQRLEKTHQFVCHCFLVSLGPRF